MSGFGLTAYRLFVFVLGLWTGSGIHDSAANHFAWHSDPLAWTAQPRLEGIINPWPFSTMLLTLATVVAAAVVWRYRGSGRSRALVALIGTALVIIATIAWFVPQLVLMDSGTLSQEQQISHARTWITLNVVRLIVLIGLFYLGLTALSDIERRKST